MCLINQLDSFVNAQFRQAFWYSWWLGNRLTTVRMKSLHQSKNTNTLFCHTEKTANKRFLNKMFANITDFFSNMVTGMYAYCFSRDYRVSC